MAEDSEGEPGTLVEIDASAPEALGFFDPPVPADPSNIVGSFGFPWHGVRNVFHKVPWWVPRTAVYRPGDNLSVGGTCDVTLEIEYVAALYGGGPKKVSREQGGRPALVV